ncbi:thymidine phosphorylase [Fusobacterium sp. IOR10]|uniref:thymidine phosphorylase n=1 Tax=Fusobacterium sp. IOR10 TaxID=2665157 RepID=UPI0013D6289C|nr:thymidine phosphorylase [Fusobacterium sp. IOR10]
MRAVDIIQNKRDGKILSKEEISFFLDGYLNEKIPDYQMSAFLMAVYFKGMCKEELEIFTEKMVNSGESIKFTGVENFLIDKHSTGGVGDKTTIALAGLFASFNIGTAKLSGRGLGHTGGTIDKFESIKGFTFPKSKEELIKMTNITGTGIMEASNKIVPLDKKIYALRDVTATVQSIPLIASSIMSKKLAIYSDGLILDVKVGSGAFMKNIDSARQLAKSMLDIGEGFKRKVAAVLTNMDEPLGLAVGNSNEVIEAIETLKGRGPKDFTELVETLTAVALMIKGDVKDLEEGKKKVREVIESGKAIKHLKDFIEYAGGDPNLTEDYSLLPRAKYEYLIKSGKSGWVQGIEAEKIGKAGMVLGAGRETKEEVIDHSVGVILCKKTGDPVKKGEVLGKLQYNNEKNLDTSINFIKEAFTISDKKTLEKKVIFEIHTVNI